MTRYILKRLLQGILTVWFIATATFFAMHAVPGDPLSGDKAMTERIRANLEAKYGLDKPLMTQYGIYLKNIAQGDFGISFTQENRKVNDIIREHFPVSATLGILAILFAGVGGILWGGPYRPLSQPFARYHHHVLGYSWHFCAQFCGSCIGPVEHGKSQHLRRLFNFAHRRMGHNLAYDCPVDGLGAKHNGLPHATYAFVDAGDYQLRFRAHRQSQRVTSDPNLFATSAAQCDLTGHHRPGTFNRRHHHRRVCRRNHFCDSRIRALFC